MADNGRRNRNVDAALLLALASGETGRKATQSAGMGERTATRGVAELRAEMLGRARWPSNSGEDW